MENDSDHPSLNFNDEEMGGSNLHPDSSLVFGILIFHVILRFLRLSIFSRFSVVPATK